MGEIFERLPSVNFSRAILERSREKMCVMKLTDVYWSDWGNEYQVRRDVERFGLQPPRGCEEKVTQKGVTT
jgi:hypothetical protein